MVTNSLSSSILSPNPLPSPLTTSDTLSPPSYIRFSDFSRRKPSPLYKPHLQFLSPPRVSSYFPPPVNDIDVGEDDNDNSSVTPEKFFENNSIADFMRFRKRGSDGDGDGGGDGVLQTAVVSFRKKFPWSLFRPFLKVDLVSTIHIGDKE